MRAKKQNKVPVVVAVIIFILIIGVAICYFIANKPDNTDDFDTNPPATTESEQSTESTDSGTDSQSVDENPTIETDKDNPKQYEGDNPNKSSTLTGVVSYKSVSGGILVIRTTINQTLSSGKCQLTLSNGSKTVSRSSDLVMNPSSSSCNGFDVPTAELGSGNWNIEIKVSSGNRTGVIKDSVRI